MKYDVNDIKSMLKEISEVMRRERTHLTELDADMGDGDLGITMCTGFEYVSSKARGSTQADMGAFLMQMGMEFNSVAPSTMGTLISTAMMSAGKAARGKTEIELPDMISIAEAAVEGIHMRGKAGRGDKTILDVLYPAIEAMRSEYEQGHEAKQVFAAVYDAAKKGLEETKNMVAKFGRPAYYGEKTIGRQDPGGTAGLYIIEGIVNYITRIHP